MEKRGGTEGEEGGQREKKVDTEERKSDKGKKNRTVEKGGGSERIVELKINREGNERGEKTVRGGQIQIEEKSSRERNTAVSSFWGSSIML